MLPEKYSNPPQGPPLFNGSKESIVADNQKFCDTTRALLDKLSAEIPVEDATFNNVLLPIARLRNEESDILSFYCSAAPDLAVREASVAAKKSRAAFRVECSMREDIFRLVDSAFSKDEDLDAESKRLLFEERRDYIRSGLALPPGPTRDRFKEIQETLSMVRADFNKNLDEEVGGIWFTLDELRGVPQDVLDGLERGTAENEGRVKMTFKGPDYNPVMRYAQSSETRRRAYVESQNRCLENVPLFKQAISLRAEAAQLLGYPNCAAYKLEIKMAKTPETVMNFLEDLRARVLPCRSREIEELLDFKKADLEARELPFDGKLYAWDLSFYFRVLKERKYSVDQLEISQYFPLQFAAWAMLRLFGELFGLVFVEIQDEEDRAKISPTGRAADIVWHEDVLLFGVWNDEDSSNPFVGYLYLDLYPRPGKYGHAAHWRLRPGFLRPDGARSYAVAAILANFTKPTAEKPSLLKHDELTTLFHEIGHGIHNLVTRTTYSDYHCNVVRDFVEAPSQMLENWCWIPALLQRFSSHYQTGEPIPDDVANRIVLAKHIGDVNGVLGQLRHNYLDMTIHMRGPADEEMNIAKYYNEMYTELTGVEGPEALGELSDWGHGYATWGHLMGGYDAGYYGYLWSEVYAMDMFYTAFKKDPVNKEQGMRYRRMVLEKGSSQDPIILLEDFLGRKPNTDAFYKDLGIGDTLPK